MQFSKWLFAFSLFALPLQEQKEQKFEITDKLVQELKQQIFPLVEKETGTKLEGVATIKIAEPEEIKEQLILELIPQFSNLVQDAEQVKKAASQSAELLSGALLAKYAYGKKAVLVSPKNIKKISGLLQEPTLLSKEALRALLVHEAVHAADEEKYQFSKILPTRKTNEAIQAYSAVVEGHAQYVARKICSQNGWEKEFEVFTRTIGKKVKLDDPGMQLLTDAITTAAALAYYDGEKFIKAIDAKKDGNFVQKAFQSPPDTFELISHPEWFVDPASRPKDAFDLDKGLAIFSGSFDSKVWTETKMALAKAQLEVSFGMLPKEEGTRLVENIKQSRVTILNFTEKPNSKMLTAGLFLFNSPKEASFYLEAAGRLAAIKKEKMSQGMVSIKKSDIEKLEQPKWTGTLNTMEIFTGTTVNVLDLNAVRESLALEVVYFNQDVKKEEMILMVDKIFDQLFENAPESSR